MKHTGANRMLAIAVGQQGLSIAEVVANGGAARKIAHVSHLPFSEERNYQNPAELGRALLAHLREHKISTRDVVIGLPVKWLVTRRKELPPATAMAAAASLRLQVEAEFASEMHELAIDYAGEPSPSASTSVLLVATNASYIQQSQALARAAKLRLRVVTVTANAMAYCARKTSGAASALSISGSGAELVVSHPGGAPAVLRYIAGGGEDLSPTTLVNEVRRAMAGSTPIGGELAFWNGCANSGEVASLLGERLQLRISKPDFDRIAHLEKPTRDDYVPAASLALMAMDNALQIDFLHSRLATPKVRSSRRPWAWAGAIAATLLIAGIIAAADLSQQKTQLADMNQRLAGMADDVKAAQNAADRLAFARQWAPGNPRYLACLSELTRVFPDEGSIWATTLTLRETMSGQLSGKASSNRQILQLLDRMRESRRFASPKLIDMREGGANNRDVAFTISFEFRPME